MVTFKELGLSRDILKAIEKLGFEKPSEIQEQSIPKLIKEDRDFIGLAQTGTGKTAAFGLPMLQRLDPNSKHIQALILAPTRELGQQITDQLNLFSKYMERISVLAVYGGASIEKQMKALKRQQHVIIATPGRLIDLIKRKYIKLDKLEYLILDEADEMLNMGFKDDLDEILSYTPEEKLTWLFSATMPREIKRIVDTYMENPIEVKVNTKNEVNENIEHLFTNVHYRDKAEALIRFLDIHADMRGLVFCRTRRGTQELAEFLMKKKYRSDALHGDLSQNQRDTVMRRFKAHQLQVLIATDVAARGIDVNDLTHVFHYTLPDDLSYYTHRSGRTARAGKKGTSIAFVEPRDKHKIGRLSKSLNIEFKQIKIPSNDSIVDIRLENWCKQIVEYKAAGKLDDQLVKKALIMFGDLTKEELIVKMLTKELEELNLGSSRDLNKVDSGGKRGSSNRSGKRSSGKGGYRKGGGSSRPSKRRSSGGSSSHRKGKSTANSYGGGGGEESSNSNSSSSKKRKPFKKWDKKSDSKKRFAKKKRK